MHCGRGLLDVLWGAGACAESTLRTHRPARVTAHTYVWSRFMCDAAYVTNLSLIISTSYGILWAW